MRKICFTILFVLLLTACSQVDVPDDNDYTDDEIPQVEDIKIPDTIFQSDKQNDTIDVEEIKTSIKTYLDANEELFVAFDRLADILYEKKNLAEEELEKLETVTDLTEENDENFAHYIANNTLPADYQEESEKISEYISNINEYMTQLDDKIDQFIDGISNGDFSSETFELIPDNLDEMNGKVQKEIEEFLDEKEIDTKAFGREE
ncbi:NDxxF motif lipoprotein [Gracilibacillus sp. S3-1-1]|uniref:NDxxF motif lipoprotein n=1 Tax=Gracilibacillus pellucidus TaxID=3095368 RepID=A0ACC6M3L2_9BACI|nr:NDxxF motif lipoprotein [Gracilibacillus sp. S3-1-1]MDX8045549.1 NDxxF motif lipoprotein [Gracilibacillus sp. S3-1-1]